MRKLAGCLFGLWVLLTLPAVPSVYGANAAPSITRITATKAGYIISGRGFGRSKAMVRVYEGRRRIPDRQIISVTETRIVVRSRPSRATSIRVVVGRQTSRTRSFVYRAPPTKPKIVHPPTIAAQSPKVGIRLTGFRINGGGAVTINRLVTLNHSTPSVVKPTHYRVSESPKFANASWIPYRSTPKYRIASPGNGIKRLYLQVKGSTGSSRSGSASAVVSNVATDEIKLSEIRFSATTPGLNMTGFRFAPLSPVGVRTLRMTGYR